MREIKFRAWNGGVMTFFKLGEHLNIKFINNPNNKIMQFTGEKDIKEKDIYEGDIILVDNQHIGVVKFRDGAFSLYSFESKYMRGFISILNEKKIIGNVFENPKLLKTLKGK